MLDQQKINKDNKESLRMKLTELSYVMKDLIKETCNILGKVILLVTALQIVKYTIAYITMINDVIEKNPDILAKDISTHLNDAVFSHQAFFNGITIALIYITVGMIPAKVLNISIKGTLYTALLILIPIEWWSVTVMILGVLIFVSIGFVLIMEVLDEIQEKKNDDKMLDKHEEM